MRIWAAAFVALVAADAVSRPSYVELVDQGRWLPALASVESLAAQQPAYVQELGRVRSLIGDWKGALHAYETFFGRDSVSPLPPSALLDSTEALDAESTILELARGRRLVILNEVHHDASQRAFATRLARGLRKLGFRHLACETFDPRDSVMQALARHRVVDHGTGIYSREPCFAEFIRGALQAGFEPVGYEAADPSTEGDFVTRFNARDSLQADALIARTFARDTSARVLVYCGYDHAMEEPDPRPGGRAVRALAARLKTLTGHDPLTIDQTVGGAPSVPERGSIAWRYAESRGLLRHPYTVFRFRDGRGWYVSGKYRGRVDLQVFHARSELVSGRPGWMVREGGRKVVLIPPEMRPASGRRVVEARYADHPAQAVPADRVVVHSGQEPPVLLLRPGRYHLTAQDEAGNPAGRARVDVPDPGK